MRVAKAIAVSALAVPASSFVHVGMNMGLQQSSGTVARRSVLGKAVAGVATLTGAFSVASVAQAEGDAPASDADGFVTTETGLQYKVVKEGTGAKPIPQSNVKAHYTGWLGGFGDNPEAAKFDSSRDRGRPFTFKAGAGQVIKAWDESILDMAVGERRLIIVPPQLGYGKRGAGGVIPPNATLYFDVELLGIL